MVGQPHFSRTRLFFSIPPNTTFHHNSSPSNEGVSVGGGTAPRPEGWTDGAGQEDRLGRDGPSPGSLLREGGMSLEAHPADGGAHDLEAPL